MQYFFFIAACFSSGNRYIKFNFHPPFTERFNINFFALREIELNKFHVREKFSIPKKKKKKKSGDSRSTSENQTDYVNNRYRIIEPILFSTVNKRDEIRPRCVTQGPPSLRGGAKLSELIRAILHANISPCSQRCRLLSTGN